MAVPYSHLISSGADHHPNTMSMTRFNSSSSSSSSSLSNNSPAPTTTVHIHIVELLLAATVFLAIHSFRQRKLHHGLPVWPVIGMVPSLISALHTNTIYEWLTSVLSRTNGTFLFIGPPRSSLNCVITSDPGNVEYLLKTNFSNFPKGPHFRQNLLDLLGHGIFNADSHSWLTQRKTTSLEFHSAKFRNLTYSSLLDLVHARLIPVLEEAAEEDVVSSSSTSSSLDLQEVLLRLTFDNVCMMAFGVDPGCLRPGLPEVPFARAFEEATEASMLRFVTPTYLWKAMRWLDVGPERVLKRSIKEVEGFAEGVIRARKKELALILMEQDDDDDKKKRSDLLTVFMGLRDERGMPFSDKFLRDICINFILAGRDTSSVALTWFFWLVDGHPEVEDKILQEIRKVVERGGGGKCADSSDYGDDDDDVVLRPGEIKRMHYLQAALSEALRLYPSVPVDHKQAVEDDVFPDGTVLKKGTKVIYAIYSMGRAESIWGKDCNEFKPERWLRDGRFTSESAYKFSAFNGGPRLCLGKDFAYYQMKFVAASIMLRYKVKVVEGHPVTPKLALTMYMKHGLKVNLYRRPRPHHGSLSASCDCECDDHQKKKLNN